MKRIFGFLIGTVLLSTAAFAAEPPKPVTPAAPPPPIVVDLQDYARIDFDVYGTTAYRGMGKGQGRLGTGVGATYWLTKSFGAGLRAETDNFQHSAVDRGILRLITRGNFLGLVPYGFVQAGYDFESGQRLDQRWLVGAGGGVRKNLLKNAGVFVEGALETTASGQSSTRGSLGVSLSLF